MNLLHLMTLPVLGQVILSENTALLSRHGEAIPSLASEIFDRFIAGGRNTSDADILITLRS